MDVISASICRQKLKKLRPHTECRRFKSNLEVFQPKQKILEGLEVVQISKVWLKKHKSEECLAIFVEDGTKFPSKRLL